MICFCPGEQVCQEERYDGKSNDLGDENIGEIRGIRVPDRNKEIINPVIRSCAPRKTPSKQGPEKGHRLRPHVVFEQVEQRCAGYKEHARIPAAPVEIKTHKSKKEDEYQRMGDEAAAGKGISKEHPSE